MLLSFPLMVAIRKFPRGSAASPGTAYRAMFAGLSPWLLNVVVALLFIANTVNIAADLAAMADATKLLIGGTASSTCCSMAWSR